MGHPGTPDHDHHQSIWFAHHKVVGKDFWGNSSGAVARQLPWLTVFTTTSQIRDSKDVAHFHPCLAADTEPGRDRDIESAVSV